MARLPRFGCVTFFSGIDPTHDEESDCTGTMRRTFGSLKPQAQGEQATAAMRCIATRLVTCCVCSFAHRVSCQQSRGLLLLSIGKDLAAAN